MASKRTGPESELIIVEGDSAARSVRQVRNAEYQAVFAMQGKPMNATKCSLGHLQGNLQFSALIQALGARWSTGPGGEVQACPMSELRYGKIILLFDPDPDGIHGRTLMLLFFYRWLRQLLDDGRVYDSHAPQWEITGTGLTLPVYAATPEHMRAVREALAQQGVTEMKWRCFRGLGSLDSELLETRCVHPATRELQVLNAGHAEQALDLFEQLRAMGQELGPG